MDLTDKIYVESLKSNFHATFDSPQGKEVIKFLEKTCCWYQSTLMPGHPELSQQNDGKRQVLATIKTILELSADQIVQLTTEKEN